MINLLMVNYEIFCLDDGSSMNDVVDGKKSNFKQKKTGHLGQIYNAAAAIILSVFLF